MLSPDNQRHLNQLQYNSNNTWKQSIHLKHVPSPTVTKMDVELYVYDLSRGLARQLSQSLTGVQIDAIYHTAIVLNNVEYFFGQGIHRKIPGSTHHGRPMKVIHLGRTDLPMDLVDEYIQSLESIYTPESYDLFLHNCNNFTQDLSVFLVGKSIPNEISSLPETFLRTPIGQMLRGQIDQSMRTMTQAPDAVAGTTAPNPISNGMNGAPKPPPLAKATFFNGQSPKYQPGHVYNITDNAALSKLLQQASKTCAVIFFTSATCPPCKIVYPAYEELAHDAGEKATFIKIDISQAYDVASRYGIRATPTFMTFLKGQKEETWSGANEAKLRGNVQLLLQMSQPRHPHSQLNLPSFHGMIERPIMYTKLPPLDKLVAKLGDSGNDKTIQSLVSYIRTREAEGMANASIPDLHSIFSYVSAMYAKVLLANRFALVDLLRLSAIDSRVSSYLATETNLTTLRTLITSLEWVSIPYQLRLVTCQFLCNLFSSPVFQEQLCEPNSPLLKMINDSGVSDCLIADNANAQQAAAALFYNLAAINHNERLQYRADKIAISEDVEASLACAVANENLNRDTLHSFLLALGMMLYAAADTGSGVWDLCGAMEMRDILAKKEKMEGFKGEVLLREVGRELLAKGAAAAS